MRSDSLTELAAAFTAWRRKKKHAREVVPQELLFRAREASRTHGVKNVVRVTRVERSRLFRDEVTKKKARISTRAVPANFSRLELSAPSSGSPRPIAEVETATGVKLRVFSETSEMMVLLSVVCGFGGGR